MVEPLSLVGDKAAADFNNDAPGVFQDGLHELFTLKQGDDAYGWRGSNAELL